MPVRHETATALSGKNSCRMETKFMSADASPTGVVWQGLLDRKLCKFNNLNSRLKYIDLDLRSLKLLRVKVKMG
jgi:hypothetical protein